MFKPIIYLFLLMFFNSIFGQISTQRVPISETYSSNGKFKLKSISFDDEFPNLKGESSVTFTKEYESFGVKKSFYKINRSFDLYDGYPFFTAISNDGRKVIYIKDKVYYNGEEHKNVTFYIDGELKKTYTTEEFINCNNDIEKCDMFYDNKYQIFERNSSTLKKYKKDTTEKDKFLYKNFVFNNNDTIYVIDSRNKITLFNLNKGEIIESKLDFDSIYPSIKRYETVSSNIDYYDYPYKYIINIENSKTNEKLSESISKISNLKFVSTNDSTFHKYKLFRINLTGYLDRKGKFEIETFEADEKFNKEEIKNYLLNTNFNTDFIPRQVDKIYLESFFGGFRNHNDSIAEIDTKLAKEKRRQEFENRKTLDSIDGIYIPKNLKESIFQLDTKLNFEARKKIKEAKSIWEFNSHMSPLGMWIRNNWGINGGSRLLKYFNERGFTDRDDISAIILEQYQKWLIEEKDIWSKWEKRNPKK